MNCFSCIYSDIQFIQILNDEESEEPDRLEPHAVCRRYPPTVVYESGATQFLPLVHEEDWCGEWKAKPDSDI